MSNKNRKMELLLARTRQRGKGQKMPGIPAAPVADSYPLSYAQQGLWLAEKMGAGGSTANLIDQISLVGRYEQARCEKALSELIRRHEILRTVFEEQDDVPVQVVLPAQPIEVPVFDLSNRDAASQHDALNDWVMRESAHAFDLQKGPLFHSALFILSPQKSLWLFCFHHLIYDGVSSGVLKNELQNLLAGKALPKPDIQYKDYAVWQRQDLNDEKLKALIGKWTEKIGKQPPVLSLPMDRLRPAVLETQCARLVWNLPKESWNPLLEMSKTAGCTPFMVLMALFQTLLFRTSHQKDFLIGSTVANRKQPQLMGLLGFFVNTLVFRAKVDPEANFMDLLETVKSDCLESFRIQELPFANLAAHYQNRDSRDLSRHPLVQVMMTMEVAGSEEEEAFHPDVFHTSFDLILRGRQDHSGLSLALEYATALFDEASIQELIKQFNRLLTGVVQNPQKPLADLDILGDEGRRKQLQTWNKTSSDFQTEANIVEVFEQVVNRQGDAIAIDTGDIQWTFSELNAAANVLAAQLRELDLRPDQAVGVHMRQMPRLAVALLGVLKAGNAYLPLDPTYPQDRLAFMIEDAGMGAVLSDRDGVAGLPKHEQPTLIMEDLEAQQASLEKATIHPLQRAYVTYTSGSTGKPKGVSITHQAVLRLALNTNYIDLEPGIRVAHASNIAFDAATFEIWSTLLNGATVVPVDRDALLTPTRFKEHIKTQALDVLFMTTALFNRFANECPDAFNPMKTILFGGEAVDPEAVRTVLNAGGPKRLLHVYGPTESTTFASWHPLEDVAPRAQTLPIGKPLANSRFYILDQRLQPVPVGVFGQLWLSGPGLARCYHDRPGLTASRFIPNPFNAPNGLEAAGERMYQTGDLVRFLPNGALEFGGRADHQVKLRGFRIEPGEIENEIKKQGDVAEVLVAVHSFDGGDRRLVAWLEPLAGHEVSTEVLRSFLGERLPSYMVPSSFVIMDRLPLNVNGKIDRKALPDPENTGIEREYIAPSTATEKALVELWAEMLSVDQVGVRDNFFELGGHSLLATKAISRIRSRFDVDLSFHTFFSQATPAELAQAIDEESGTRTETLDIPKVDRTGTLALSYGQQRMWFLNRLEGESAAYNMAGALPLNADVDFPSLLCAIEQLMARHESLRTCFPTVNGKPIQEIKTDMSFQLEHHDLSAVAAESLEDLAKKLAQAEAEKPFDLAKGPLFRGACIHMKEGQRVLLLTMHHIISDGWSVRVLMQELVEIYKAMTENRDPELPALPIQYADYAAWQQSWLEGETPQKQLAYWTEKLAEPRPVLDFPCDHARPTMQSFEGSRVELILNPTLVEKLEGVARANDATPYMMLLSVWSLVLQVYSGQNEFIIGSPIANRNRGLTDNLIGFFVNTLALRIGIPTDRQTTFSQVLGDVRRNTLEALDNQDIPFEMLVDALRIKRDLSRNPLFQVLFDYHDDRGNPGAFFSEDQNQDIYPRIDAAICDLSLSLIRGNETMLATLEYGTSLFEEATVRRVLDHFVHVLELVTQQPDMKLTALSLPASQGNGLMPATWNFEDAHRNELVMTRFSRQAKQTPAAPAISLAGESCSYDQLEKRSNQLAHWLLRKGLSHAKTVGVCMPRSKDAVIAVFALLKAGATYVPIDPEYPAERQAYLVENAGLELVLTNGPQALDLDCAGVNLEKIAEDLEEQPTEAPDVAIDPQQLAYVIYTSGSTGQPKGVMISHAALGNFTRLMEEKLALKAGDRILQFASLSFDVSVEEIFPTLCAGATLVLPDNPRSLSFEDFTRLVWRERLTGFEIPTHFWSEWVHWLKENEAPLPTSLRHVMVGTERIIPERLNQWLDYGIPLLHVYGLTEATVTTLTHEITPGQGPFQTDYNPPVGLPNPGAGVVILDELQRPVPVGVSGTLHVAGLGLAQGYHNQPALTADRFIPNPFGPAGSRLYNSGDLARFDAAGRVVFIGRKDTQVKLRGYRIELGEIQSALAEHPALADVVARVVGTGDKQLVAWWSLVADAQAPESNELRRFLEKRLPVYMVPDRFIVLESFPMTPNNKIDVANLPLNGAVESRTEQVAPTRDLERDMLALWKDLLGHEAIGIRDNFFDCGGNSMKIVNLQSRLERDLKVHVSVVDLFQYATIEALCDKLSGDDQNDTAKTQKTKKPLKVQEKVAIVGMAARFPGSPDLETFWKNLCAGHEAISFFDDETLREHGVDAKSLSHPAYVKAKAVLEEGAAFDADFFGYSPRDAELMDPQHRVFLELAWTALEHAGYAPRAVPGRVGVYAGAGRNTYLLNNLAGKLHRLIDADAISLDIGNSGDFLATRIAHKLDLNGPALNLQTACSTSLVSVAQAVQALLLGTCDMALAGGVTVGSPRGDGYFYQEGGILSPDGHCRPFDVKAAGTVPGEGAGAVVLKRLDEALADGDRVYAVIRGAAINNDGHAKVGFTAPGIEGQAEVIAAAHEQAGMNPRDMGYIEAHGTGTALGDPVEIAALNQAFGRKTNDTGFCALGSVKANLGHADAAAGIAGLIKTALSLHHGKLPAMPHFEAPNPSLELDKTPFHIPTQLMDWKSEGKPRCAGVSSFGIGGTNAHVVLEEACVEPVNPSAEEGPRLFVLSANTTSALETQSTRMAEAFEELPKNATGDVVYTLQRGRQPLRYRRAVVASNLVEAAERLRNNAGDYKVQATANERPALTFLFPGQGSQYPNMARGLYETEVNFRETVDECAALLQGHLGLDIRSLLFPETDSLDEAAAALAQTRITQPALFVIEYALARFWMDRGLKPEYLLGHSIGEYVAACLADVFSLEDALRLVAARGRLIQSLPAGAMLAVFAEPETIAPFLAEDLDIAAHNGPSRTVVAGTFEAIEQLESRLQENAIAAKRLHTSHAFHSTMMDPILDHFRAEFSDVVMQAPKLTVISNLEGKQLSAEQACDPEYWVRHLRHQVRFSASLGWLAEQQSHAAELVFLEVGPGRTLTTLAGKQLPETTGITTLPDPKGTDLGYEGVLLKAGHLWAAGISVEWDLIDGGSGKRMALPTYPFERRRFWFEPQVQPASPAVSSVPVKDSDLDNWFYLPSWQRTLPATTTEDSLNWLVLGEADGFSDAVCAALATKGQKVARVHAHTSLNLEGDILSLDPTNTEHYQSLMLHLSDMDLYPDRVLHLWAMGKTNDFERSQELGLFAVMNLIEAVTSLSMEPPALVLGTHNLQQGHGPGKAHQATLTGLVRVLPQEMPRWQCRAVDMNGALDDVTAINLVNEALSAQSPSMVALQAGSRWVEEYRQLKAESKPILREGGVYLITGGLGWIGLLLAEHLMANYGARVALLSRGGLPPESQWDALCENAAGDDRQAIRIGRFREWQARGFEPLVLRADVADPEALEAAVVETEEKLGKLQGVFHAAGLTDDRFYGPLLEGGSASCKEHFAPKIHGLHALEAVLADRDFDFCMLFSSVASVLGGLGYLGYAAANAYLDAWVQNAQAQGDHRWLSVAWDGWLLGADPGDAPAGSPASLAMTDAEGLVAVEKALNYLGNGQLIVSTGSLTLRRAQWSQGLGNNDDAPKANVHQRPELANDYIEPRDPLEEQLCELWQDMLGLDRVGIDDHFFDLGGDSLTAVQLASRLWERFGLEISSAEVLEWPTVAQMGDGLLMRLSESEMEECGETV